MSFTPLAHSLRSHAPSQVVLIYLATQRAYGTGHFSIFKGTITLDQSYKIVGISGGPIAGPINQKRELVLLFHKAAMIEFAILTTIHTLAEFLEYYRRKKYKESEFEPSAWAWFFGAAYFLGWGYALLVSGVGFIICVVQYSHEKLNTTNSIDGISVSPQDGAKFAAVACATLLVVGLWRVIVRSTYQNGAERDRGQGRGDDEKAVKIQM